MKLNQKEAKFMISNKEILSLFVLLELKILLEMKFLLLSNNVMKLVLE